MLYQSNTDIQQMPFSTLSKQLHDVTEIKFVDRNKAEVVISSAEGNNNAKYIVYIPPNMDVFYDKIGEMIQQGLKVEMEPPAEAP